MPPKKMKRRKSQGIGQRILIAYGIDRPNGGKKDEHMRSSQRSKRRGRAAHPRNRYARKLKPLRTRSRCCLNNIFIKNSSGEILLSRRVFFNIIRLCFLFKLSFNFSGAELYLWVPNRQSFTSIGILNQR